MRFLLSGAGENINQASKPYIIEMNEIKIGIYTCTENEFSIASNKKPGANPLDPLESLDHINNLKKSVILLLSYIMEEKNIIDILHPIFKKYVEKWFIRVLI